MKAGYSLLAGSRISAAILQTVSLLLLARWSDPSTFGQVAAVLGALVFASAATNLGLANYVSRVRALDVKSPLVPAAIALNRYTSLLHAVIGIGIGLVLGLSAPVAVLISISTALDKNSDTTTSVLVADQLIGAPAIVSVLRRLIPCVMLPALYLSSVSLPVELLFSLGLLAGSIAGNVVAQIGVRSLIDWNVRAPLRTVFRETRHFWVTLIGNQLKELQPTIVLVAAGPFIGGIFAAALRFTRPMVLLAGFAAQVLLPSVTRLGAASAWRAARGVAIVSLVATVPLLLALPLTPWMIELVIGAGYEDAVLPTQILVVGSPIIASTVPLGAVLQGQGLVKEAGRVSSAFGVFGVVLLFVVASFGDVTTSAVTVVVISLAQAIVQLVVARGAK